MARLASVAKAGFYATPKDLLDSIADLVVVNNGYYRSVSLCDPCAGEGEAIEHLTYKWDAHPYACELESTRYEKVKSRIHGVTLHGDAFHLHWTGSADILYLNPPYDTDKEFKRYENKWLHRFTEILTCNGVLLFVIPIHALAACAKTLAENYEDIQVFKFPDPHYDAYKQVVVVGKKRVARCESPYNKLVDISKGNTAIPNLGTAKHVIEAPTSGYLHWNLTTLDIHQAVADYKPWHENGKVIPDTVITVEEEITYKLASIPKPSYIAAALASGVFNGVVLYPNEEGLPPILAKGVFNRAFKEIDQRTNKDGQVTGVVEVQRPELDICVFDLTTGTYHTLERSMDPLSATDISAMSCGDLIKHYSEALVKTLLSRCNVLYDPARDGASPALPDFQRTPYPAQASAIRTLIKLLRQDEKCAWLMGEIGSGKTTVALSTAIAMGAKRPLVMAPPHLVPQWEEEQIPAIWKDAKVRRLDTISDIDAWARDEDPVVIGLLSREAAKLGHSYEGVSGKCPKCGVKLRGSKKKNAEKRQRCIHQIRRPANEWADIYLRLRAAKSQGSDYLRSALEQLYEDTEDSQLEQWILMYLNDDDFLLRLVENGNTNASLTRHAHTSELHDEIKTAVNAPWYMKFSDTYPYQRLENGDLSFNGVKAGTEDCWKKLLDIVDQKADWVTRKCDEPLFSAVGKPRRYPLARYISKRHANLPDFIILDEAHELANTTSAQSKAGQQLYNLRAPKIAMTGSTMNGYASTLFLPLWFFNNEFRNEFPYGKVNDFIKQYGYIRRVVEEFDSQGDRIEYGSHSNCVKKYRTSGQAPGVLPSLLLRYFLRSTVTLHINELGIDLPPCEEIVRKVDMLEEQSKRYQETETALITQIQQDAFTELMGKLFGQMSLLPSCPDRLTNDVGNQRDGTYTVAYPAYTEAGIVSRVECLPSSQILPKEQELLDIVKNENSEGRNVLVLVWNVNNDNVKHRSIAGRVCDLLNAPYLDAKKVTPKKRVAWIQKNVVKKNAPVLVAQPSAIKTGINNLVHFSTIVFYQNPGCSPEVRRQVRGRIVRVGQTKATRVYTLLYEGSAQIYEHKLLLHKVAISEYTDGLDPESALAASGISDDSDMVGTDIGKALYKMMEAR